MSNPFHQYQDDVPSAIAQKLNLLREQEKRIISLEKELGTLRGHHAILEAELALYRKVTKALIGPDDTDCSINRLPNELLELTFEHFIKHKHRAIITLLFVCKRWHSIVISSPRLWARIEITNAFELFDLPFQKSAESYITKCLELSAGLPLHVHLDFRFLPDCIEYIQRVVSDSAYHVVDPDQHEELSGALDIFGWDKFDAPNYRAELGRALEMVVGANSKNIRRWNSLYVAIPRDPSLVGELLTAISRGGATLTSLEVAGQWRGKHFNQGVFGNMSTIKCLTIDTAMSLSTLGVSRRILQVLNIHSRELSNLSELSKLTFLHTLAITALDDGWNANKEVVPSFPINLPKLHTLTIEMAYWRLAQISWVLPSIRYYNLHYTFPVIGSTKTKIPQISARHLGLEGTSGTGYSIRDIIHQTVLDEFLFVSPDVETLTTKHYDKILALRTISSAKRQGRLRLLKQLTIENHLKVDSLNVMGVEEVDALIAEIEAREENNSQNRSSEKNRIPRDSNH